MSGEDQLVLMVAGMHLLGLGCVAVLMVLAFRQDPGEIRSSGEQESDEGWGNKPQLPRRPGGKPRGGIPLPDAEPAGVRLRDHRKLPDFQPPHERRPAREPQRAPRPARIPAR